MTAEGRAAHDRTPQVFISYAREDFEPAQEVYRFLKKLGVHPFMDKFDLVGGQDWERVLLRQVRTSDFFIFCASPRSVSKRGVLQKEVKEALGAWEGKLEDDIFFIPVRLEPCDIPESIRKFQWIDLFESDGRQRIERSIREGIARLQGDEFTGKTTYVEKTYTGHMKGVISIEIHYPQFQPTFLPELAAINATLEGFAMKLANRFERHGGGTFLTVRDQAAALQLGDPKNEDSLWVRFRREYIGDELISVEFLVGTYFAGAAHPNSHTQTFNFRRHPFMQLDLFDLGESYFEGITAELSKFCSEALLRESIERGDTPNEPWVKSGVDPLKGDYSRFLLSPDGMRIIFDEYEVGSYAEGRREVLIPREKRIGLLDPEIIGLLESHTDSKEQK